MNILSYIITAINASYTHTNLAVRSIAAYEPRHNIKVLEYTINNRIEAILAGIFAHNPRVIGLSVYIWNADIVAGLLPALRTILPETLIVLGGPEVSFDYDIWFTRGADIIVIGEGERTFSLILDSYENNMGYGSIHGIAYLSGGEIIRTLSERPLPLSALAFPYNNIEEMRDKILYYQSSKGCPYACHYCLNSNPAYEGRLRLLETPRVLADLDVFIKNRVKQVKFIDRTFNANPARALEIWKFLVANDNGYTNFHFELCAELLDETSIRFLKRARVGLFQFEIGIQSTNPRTLEAIGRRTNLEKLFTNTRHLLEAKNIHIHVDLIAGLPHEDYSSFARSFDAVYRLGADMLQLGFLKLIKGSKLRDEADDYGIKAFSNAPYRVLSTHVLSFADLVKLENIETVINWYYNTGAFANTLGFVLARFDSPFRFYEKLAEFFDKNGNLNISHTRTLLFKNLYVFCSARLNATEILALEALMRLDMLLTDLSLNMPEWLVCSANTLFSAQIANAYRRLTPDNLPKRASKLFRIEAFSLDIQRLTHGEIIPRICLIAFRRGDDGRVTYTDITEENL